MEDRWYPPLQITAHAAGGDAQGCCQGAAVRAVWSFLWWTFLFEQGFGVFHVKQSHQPPVCHGNSFQDEIYC